MAGAGRLNPRRRRPGQRRCPRDRCGERGETSCARETSRERLVEDGRSRGDRKRVREQRCHARRRQRTASLEAELERHERKSVQAEDRGDQGESGPSADGSLGGHVPCCVQKPGGEPEARPRRERSSTREQRDQSGQRRRSEPAGEPDPGRSAVRGLIPDEREREEQQAPDGQRNPCRLAACRPHPGRAPDEQPEKTDSAG
jgi:hypothetical protein